MLNKEFTIIPDQEILDLLSMYFAIWWHIDEKNIAEIFANVSVHPDFSGRFDSQTRGPQKVLEIAEFRRKAFNDSHFVINEKGVRVNANSEISVPYVFYGTYQGEFLPSIAVGKSVAMPGIAYYKMMNGKLLGLRSERNEELMFKQLGVQRPTGYTNEF